MLSFQDINGMKFAWFVFLRFFWAEFLSPEQVKRTRSLQSRMPCRHFPCKAKTCKLFGECGPTLVLEQSPEGLACSQCPTWRMAQRVRCTWKGTGMLISNTNSSLQDHGISVPPTYSLTSCTWHLPTGTGHGSYHGTVTLLCVCGLGIKPPALETGGFRSSFDPESQDMVCTDGGYPLSMFITRIPRVSPGLSGAAASPSLRCFRAIFFRSKMTLIN